MANHDSAIMTVAELMALSARTAPKGVGKDYLDIKILSADDSKKIGDEMVKAGEEKGVANMVRDGKNMQTAQGAVLIGLKEHPAIGLNCGACGYGCDDFSPSDSGSDFVGPNCAIRLLDMGIALGSAAKTAGMHNADNRIMYRAGVFAKKLGFTDAWIVMAIPLSATGKSPYFDR